MTRDPEVEVAGMDLAWLDRPAALFGKLSDQTIADKIKWWRALGPFRQGQYRLRASVVLEAVDRLKSVADVAAE